MRVIFAAFFLSAMSAVTQADTITVKGDIGVWRAALDGEAGHSAIPMASLGHGNNSHRFMHLSVEHFVPLVPNYRLAYSDIKATRSTVWDAGKGHSTIDLTHVDNTAYYKLLDNWINLDLGLSLRTYDGRITIITPDTADRIKIDKVLPMGFVLLEAELPFIGWAAGVEGNYTNFNDYKVTDYSIKLRYLFDSLVDLGFEFGYRSHTLKINKTNGADLTLDGPYAAFAFKF